VEGDRGWKIMESRDRLSRVWLSPSPLGLQLLTASLLVNLQPAPKLNSGQKRVLETAAVFEALAQPGSTTSSPLPTVRGAHAPRTVWAEDGLVTQGLPSKESRHGTIVSCRGGLDSIASCGNEGIDSCASCGHDDQDSSFSSGNGEFCQRTSLAVPNGTHVGTACGTGAGPLRPPAEAGLDDGGSAWPSSAGAVQERPTGLSVSSLRDRFFNWEWASQPLKAPARPAKAAGGEWKPGKGVKQIITELQQEQVIGLRRGRSNARVLEHSLTFCPERPTNVRDSNLSFG
jgi:hypothetical protein